MLDDYGLMDPDAVAGVDPETIAGMSAGYAQPVGSPMNWLEEPIPTASGMPPMSGRPAGPPGPVEAPPGLPGPIYPGKGWHVGPSVAHGAPDPFYTALPSPGFGEAEEPVAGPELWRLGVHASSLFMGYQIGEAYKEELGLGDYGAYAVAIVTDIATSFGLSTAFSWFGEGVSSEQKRRVVIGAGILFALAGASLAWNQYSGKNIFSAV